MSRRLQAYQISSDFDPYPQEMLDFFNATGVRVFKVIVRNEYTAVTVYADDVPEEGFGWVGRGIAKMKEVAGKQGAVTVDHNA